MANCGAMPSRGISAITMEVMYRKNVHWRWGSGYDDQRYVQGSWKTLSWGMKDGALELALHRPPCNEIGTAMLEDLERLRGAGIGGGECERADHLQQAAGWILGRCRFTRALRGGDFTDGGRTSGRRAGVSGANSLGDEQD